MSVLLAVPNISAARDGAAVAAVGAAYEFGGARLLDTHSDPDHDRSVHTLAAAPGRLAHAVLAGAVEAVARIDLAANRGAHPRVGVLDVAPVVHLDRARRGAACAEALVLAELLGGELALPVFLYGALAGGRTRAQLRAGGLEGLARRIAAGELRPDFGQTAPHPRAGAVLVGARAPLVAFNIELAAPASLADARAIAILLREGGEEGLPGVRAIGVELAHRGGIAQVSFNVEDHEAVALAELVGAVARHAPVARCELVGLAPAAAFAGFPEDVEVANRRTVEDALAAPPS